MALRTPLSVTPHLYMGDVTGKPLDYGTVYFGQPNKDPEFYPIELFSDDALTLPLAQPVHTKGGYLYDKGDMVEPHAKEVIYSVKVFDSYGRKVFYKGAMMRNSWNDDVIEQINAAIVASTDIARQVATDITNDTINNTAIEGGVLADTFVVVTANGTGSVARTQRDKNADFISAEDLGMVANDATFDNAPMFSLLNGRTLHLKSGATYYTQGKVVVTSKNVALVSDGTPAKVHCLAEGASCFETVNSTGYITDIVESITIGQRRIKVANAGTIKSGDILELVSSELWHADNRDETYKSQLCKVDKVIGNTLYLYDALLESYDTSNETVVVTSYSPSTVNIRNVTFQCTPIPDVDGNSPQAKGLIISRATDSLIDNVSTIDGQATGVYLHRCYNTTVSGGVSTGCNAYQTGYGVQTSGTANCTITGRTILGSRKGVDVSGIGVISTNTRVTANTVVGGGTNSWGRVYGWEVDAAGTYRVGAYQGGVGSHGSANYTYISDNILQNLHTAISCKGIQEHVTGNYIYGKSRSGAISISHGGDVFIEGNYCISGHNDGTGRNLGIFDGGANKNTRVADTFIMVEETFKGRLVVRNNTVDVQEVFITVKNSLSTIEQALIVTGNAVKHVTSASESLCYLLNTYDGTPRDIAHSSKVIRGNQQRRYGGSGALHVVPPNWIGSNSLSVGSDVPTDVSSSTTSYTVEANAASTYGGTLAAQRVGNAVSCNLLVIFSAVTAGALTKILVDVPFLDSNFAGTTRATGLAVSESGDVGFVESRDGTKQVLLSLTPKTTGQQRVHLSFSYFA